MSGVEVMWGDRPPEALASGAATRSRPWRMVLGVRLEAATRVRQPVTVGELSRAFKAMV